MKQATQAARTSGRVSALRIVGLMSGTSADGIDAALIEVRPRRGPEPWPQVTLLALHSEPYTAATRRQIFAACDPATSGIDLVCHLHAYLGDLFARAVGRLLAGAKAAPASVGLIGSHGQTVYHNPHGAVRSGGGRGRRRFAPSTLQLGDPAVIAQRTGITTIGNFRTADVAAGGEGAPLTPLPHAWLFGHRRERRGVLNLGGIANLTLLVPSSDRRRTPQVALAFDCGPANMVIDGLMLRFSGGRRRFDRNGRVAANGRVHAELLRELLRHPFLRRRPPRSAGREEFGGRYVEFLMARGSALRLSEADLLATATELTAASIEHALRRFVMPRGSIERLILCGGGVRNRHLVARLAARLPELSLEASSQHGLPEQAVEAVSFALLAYATARGWPGNVPRATGARQAVVLGVLAPALSAKKW